MHRGLEFCSKQFQKHKAVEVFFMCQGWCGMRQQKLTKHIKNSTEKCSKSKGFFQLNRGFENWSKKFPKHKAGGVFFMWNCWCGMTCKNCKNWKFAKFSPPPYSSFAEVQSTLAPSERFSATTAWSPLRGAALRALKGFLLCFSSSFLFFSFSFLLLFLFSLSLLLFFSFLFF